MSIKEKYKEVSELHKAAMELRQASVDFSWIGCAYFEDAPSIEKTHALAETRYKKKLEKMRAEIDRLRAGCEPTTQRQPK